MDALCTLCYYETTWQGNTSRPQTTATTKEQLPNKQLSFCTNNQHTKRWQNTQASVLTKTKGSADACQWHGNNFDNEKNCKNQMPKHTYTPTTMGVTLCFQTVVRQTWASPPHTPPCKQASPRAHTYLPPTLVQANHKQSCREAIIEPAGKMSGPLQ